jgi:hypothetical protein
VRRLIHAPELAQRVFEGQAPDDERLLEALVHWRASRHGRNVSPCSQPEPPPGYRRATCLLSQEPILGYTNQIQTAVTVNSGRSTNQ